MNYLRTYCNLIRKAEERGYTKRKAKEQELYVEAHHTFPVSIFGKNKRIVYLTAREHYIAHALLEKICIKRYGLNHYRTYKMLYAHIFMSRGNYINSHIYEEAKKRLSEHKTGVRMREESKLKLRNQRLGKKQSLESVEIRRQKNTGKKRTQEQKDRMSRAQRGLRKKPYKVEDENFKNKFIDAVKTSKTKREIAVKLRMNPNNGSSIESIIKWGNFLDLDMSHLIGIHINKNRISSEQLKKHWSNIRKGKLKTEEHKKKIKLSNCKYVYTFISPEGIITETIFCRDFCKENNLNTGIIRKVAAGEREHHKGWKVSKIPRTMEDK